MTKLIAIQKVVVGSGGSSYIDFNSIPQTFTDLVIKLSGRGTTGGESNITITFNGGGGTYTGKRLYGNGTSTSSDSTAQWAGFSASSAHTSNTFSNTEIYIQNYKSSSAKSFNVHTANENASSSCLLGIGTQLWSGTSAITSIRLTPDNPFAQHSIASLYGIRSMEDGAKATGGLITSDENYFYHTFLNSEAFVPTQNLTVDYLVIAGGASGGNGDTTGLGGGGGGAGGLRSTIVTTGGGGSLESPIQVTANTTYSITVGAGAAAPTGSAESGASGQGVNGSNSVFSTITATGGGGGGRQNADGSSGGSGGGGAYNARTGGAGTGNQGYNGGTHPGNAYYTSAGGGGAGASGTGGTSTVGGDGGAGVLISSLANITYTGVNGYYAGGGGGSGYPALGTSNGSGGVGGGGNGGNQTSGSSGRANTGGGGGGSGGAYNSGLRGGTGGSGLVIIRYAR
jgi:hypothetical protein